MGNVIVDYEDYWNYQDVDNQTPAPSIPSSGWSYGQAPFGVAGAGSNYPVAPNTVWPLGRGFWAQKTINVASLYGIVIEGNIENGCFIYVNGTLVLSVNPENDDLVISTGEPFTVSVPPNIAKLGNNTISIFGFDEVPTGTSTYLLVRVTELATACAFPLGEVVKEICLRAGLEAGQIDTTALSGNVNGLQIKNEQEAYEWLLSLSEAFLFDPTSYDGVLHFEHRGGDSVKTIDPDDIIGDGLDEKVRRSPQTIPQVVNLNYYDVSGGVDTDKQTSDRSIDTRGEDQENITTDIVMTADFAAQLVVKKHKIIIEEQKGDFKITLPDSYLELVTADIIKINDERFRIQEVRIDDGTLDVSLIYDRKSAYTSNVTGILPVPPPDPISTVPGETLIELIDTHILASGDDTQLGFYVAISGQKPAWSGATVEFSEDGGNTWIDLQTASTPAIMGELVSALGEHSAYIPDQHNTVQVEVKTPNLGLESATLAQMMSRANRALIGDEIINFGNVTEVSPGVWELSYLLRGRLGTDAVSHAIGERFVMLDRAFIEYYPTEKYNLNQQLTLRATSFNSTTQSTTTETFVGNSQTERKVGYLRARRIDGGEVVIEWIGTGREGGKADVEHGDYFAGYRVDVGGTITDTTTESLTTSIPGSTTTIKVYQLNSITGQGPAVEITV